MKYQKTIDAIFDWCVDFLLWLGSQLGMTYNEINIWLFVIIHPLLTLFFMWLALHYFRKYNKLKS